MKYHLAPEIAPTGQPACALAEHGVSFFARALPSTISNPSGQVAEYAPHPIQVSLSTFTILIVTSKIK